MFADIGDIFECSETKHTAREIKIRQTIQWLKDLVSFTGHVKYVDSRDIDVSTSYKIIL